MSRPYIIGISGESGVGKTTIANTLSLYLGKDDVVRVSTDDLHKWERANPNWDKFTHLNPAANNLELGDIQIRELADNRPVYRSVYNHDTGNFNPPFRIQSKKYVINEGLHAFYSDDMKGLVDLKIYVDTDDDLRTHWKLIRDTESRGYKYNSVMEAINKRKADRHYICEQKETADVIIKLGTAGKIRYLGYKKEDIFLTVGFEYKNRNAAHDLMFAFIEEFMLDLNDFTKMSNTLGNNIGLCQNNGGNVSVKMSNSLMIIKASGYEMKDIHGLNGHSVVDCKMLGDGLRDGTITDNWGLVRRVAEAVPLPEYKRPSMETGFHACLKKYVVHTHPIYLNVILCLDTSREIIEKIYGATGYAYIEYQNPGFDVSKRVAEGPIEDVYFLENHGLIVSGDDRSEAIQKTLDINEAAKKYLADNCGYFMDFSLDFASMHPEKKFFYPDSAVFLDDETCQKKEILAAHNYISRVGGNMGSLRYLSPENISFLQTLESEVYRKSL